MWYKKHIEAASNSLAWNAPERYGWFSVGIEWAASKEIDDFQEDEEVRDMVEDNCLLATAQLERVGFPKQHSYILFSKEYMHNPSTGTEAGAMAESHMIRFPAHAVYDEDWSTTLVHEWSHQFFKNLNKGAKESFSNQYDSLIKEEIEKDDSPSFLAMVEEVVPEDIKEKFPDDYSIWKLYVANTLYKPEMERIREYVRRKGVVPSSYATVNPEELWCECITNYSKLSREMRQMISNMIGGY